MIESIRLAGLYKREGKKGPYLWGKVTQGEYQGCELVIFPNPKKEHRGDADFFCYLNPDRSPDRQPTDKFAEFFDTKVDRDPSW